MPKFGKTFDHANAAKFSPIPAELYNPWDPPREQYKMSLTCPACGHCQPRALPNPRQVYCMTKRESVAL